MKNIKQITSSKNYIIDQIFFQQIEIGFSHQATLNQKFDPILIKISIIQMLRKYPKTYQIWKSDVQTFRTTIIQKLVQSVYPDHNSFQYQSLLFHTHIIFIQIPYSKQIYKSINQIVEKDMRKWIVLQGTIIRSIQRKTLEKSKIFRCTQCGHSQRLFTSYNNNYHFQLNMTCNNMVEKQKNNSLLTQLFSKLNKRKSKSMEKSKNEQQKVKTSICGNKKFQPQQQNKIFIDYQQIRIQEPFKHISSGRMPRTISIVLEGVFIDEFRPGDNITVSGLLTERYYKLNRDARIQSQMIILANNLLSKRTRNKQEFQDFDNQTMSQISFGFQNQYRFIEQGQRILKQIQLRNQIIQNFCPELYSKQAVKLGVLLCILGGVAYFNQNTKIRGQSHLLLVGQPGTGKSVLLKGAAELSQRSFFTNAIGSSTAGLTVSYVKQNGSWVLQAGALVLADSGICCIDQLNLLNKKDYPSMLEAMEQQTISSAKAGVIGKLNCRTTVIAACNPVKAGQKYDKSFDICQNTGLSPPLISRFDLIIILDDNSDYEEDMKKCNHILQKFINNENKFYDQKLQKKKVIKLKSIIKKAKSFEPEITEQKFLTDYFINLRQKETKTVRALQSLCRLTQAHAKLMLRQKVTLFDCISVIGLMEGKYISNSGKYEEFKYGIMSN